MRSPVYLNRIATALPPHQVHDKFLEWVPSLIADERSRRLFAKLASKSHIETRFSVMEPNRADDSSGGSGCLDAHGIYRHGHFPSTAKRMALYKENALPLASRAVAPLLEGFDRRRISHVIVTSCTGFYAPGLDLELQREFALRSDVERTVIGFMGCYAAFNGMKTAWHIVRSQPEAVVLLVSLELCTLHLHEDSDLEQLLAFMQFADGCAAALISAEPNGLQLRSFQTDVMAEERDLITWHVGDQGFDMYLSPSVPQALAAHVSASTSQWLDESERDRTQLWAVHPGGRSILDAVGDKLHLNEVDLRYSREILRRCGNMSSATILFVLDEIRRDPSASGNGVALAFGPGLTMESMIFEKGAAT